MVLCMGNTGGGVGGLWRRARAEGLKSESVPAGTGIGLPAHPGLDDLLGHPPAGGKAAPALPLVGARFEYEDGNIVRLKSATRKAMKRPDRDGRR
jgi:hypothetical protein